MTRKSDENWTEWLAADAAGDEGRAEAALGRAMRACWARAAAGTLRPVAAAQPPHRARCSKPAPSG